MSSLKDLYENPDLEEESEEDSDFIPDDHESDDQEEVEDSEEDEEASTTSEATKDEKDTASKEDKKSKIDAIWAEMNKPAESKKKPITQEEIQVPAEPTPELKRKSSSPISSTSKRPKSNLNSLMNKYKIKEPKMNTLEKSKLDWKGFVQKEGIEDELKYKNKDGYMEKVAFLNRVDDRRLNQLKQGQNKKKD